jgi:hypothetical protein
VVIDDQDRQPGHVPIVAARPSHGNGAGTGSAGRIPARWPW